MSKKQRAYLLLTLTVCIWGGMYVAGKVVLGTIPPITTLCVRYLLSSIALVAVLCMTHRCQPVKKEDWKYIAIIGVVGYFCAILLQTYGMKYANASIASLINAMNPVAIILFAVPLLGERITATKVIAVACSVGGAYAILGGAAGHDEMLGILFSIVSVVLWSLVSILVRRLSARYDPLMLTAYGVFIAMICIIPASVWELYTTDVHIQVQGSAVVGLLYMSFLGTALAHYLWNNSLSLIEAGRCSLFYPLQPLVATILGVLFLHEPLTVNLVIGGVLIIGGILVSVLGDMRHQAD